MLVASLVVNMNIECVKIEANGNGATVGSEFGCENEYWFLKIRGSVANVGSEFGCENE